MKTLPSKRRFTFIKIMTMSVHFFSRSDHRYVPERDDTQQTWSASRESKKLVCDCVFVTHTGAETLLFMEVVLIKVKKGL